MPSFKLTIAYDGTAYKGWQRQSDAPTIQGTIEDALSSFFGRHIPVTSSGRTDAGVHAAGQVAVFSVDSIPDSLNIGSVLNGLLPGDIRIQSYEHVTASFHPRYDAKQKVYRYALYQGRVENPLLNRFHALYPFCLDHAVIKNACRVIQGIHDFYSLCADNPEIQDHRRTIHEFDYARSGEVYEFVIAADGFLYKMVRIIMGTVLDASRGKIPLSQIQQALEVHDKSLAGPCMPACGLTLLSVKY